MMTVGILGYGEIGRAIATVLSKNTHVIIHCWDKNVDILPNQPHLSTMIPNCEVLFVCIPTWLVRSALQGIRDLISPSTILISVSKGFEKETCTRVDRLFSAILSDNNPLVFLGGPMIAEELIAGSSTHAVAASTYSDACTTVSRLFDGTTVRVEQSDDFEGVVTAASLKNIYALGLGICDALNLGANAHGVFLTLAIQEMTRIIAVQGGRAETALGLAGLGDLVATTQSQNSTNYSTGVRFARGLAPVRGSEALNTLPCIMTTIPNIANVAPLLSAIHAIVVNGADVKRTMRQFLT